MDSGVNNNGDTIKPPKLEMLTLTALVRIPRRVLQFETKLKQPWKPCRVEVGEGWIKVLDGKDKVVCKDQLFRLNCHSFQNNIVIQSQNTRFKLRPYSGSENQFNILKDIIQSRWNSVEPARGNVFYKVADTKESRPTFGFHNNVLLDKNKYFNTLAPSVSLSNNIPNGHTLLSKEAKSGNKINETGKSGLNPDMKIEPTKFLIHEKTVQSRKIGVSSYQVSREEMGQGMKSGSKHHTVSREEMGQGIKSGRKHHPVSREEMGQGMKSGSKHHKYQLTIGNQSENGLNNKIDIVHEENNNIKPKNNFQDEFDSRLSVVEKNKNHDYCYGNKNTKKELINVGTQPYFKVLKENKNLESTPDIEQKVIKSPGIDIKKLDMSVNVIEKTIDTEVDNNGIENSANVMEKIIFNELNTKDLIKTANVIEKTIDKLERKANICVDSKNKLSDQFEKAMKNFDDQINIFKSLSLPNTQAIKKIEGKTSVETMSNENKECRSRSISRQINTDKLRCFSREKSREKIRNKTILQNQENTVLKIYFN